jgi:ParB-like chromosome segregation protein Spo0J
MSEITEIPINRLYTDDAYQPRAAGLDHEHLERLRASDPACWPPVLVSPNTHQGEGYAVIDGFHRLHVARERGMATLRCEVVEGAGYPEAFAANLAHGLPLAMQDRKEFVVWLHEQEPVLSYREIARRSGLSDKTVKAALDAADSPHPLPRLPAAPPDPIERMVKLAVAAMTDQTGVNKLAQLFSKKTDAQQRAEYVSHVLAAYHPEERKEVATALMACGSALIDGARAAISAKQATK